VSGVESISEQLKPGVEAFEKMAEREESDKLVVHRLSWTSPAIISILIAGLGLIGNFVVSWYNDRNSRSLEVAKMQSDLILRAVSSRSLQQSCQNLNFFINTGLIADTNTKITQECTHPLQQTYIPAFNAPAADGAPVSQNMAISVTRTDSATDVQYNVAFTVPNRPDINFNTVKIYCTQMTGTERTSEKTWPSLQGNWKPGDRVTFSVKIPKDLADPSKGWHFTYCVGSEAVCFPSPNLLRWNS
jgi:hypothetical protein